MAKKNILIYSIGSLGDTLITLPAIEAIVRMHEDCRFVFLADRHPLYNGYVSSWDIVGKLGYFDEVIFYDANIQSTRDKIKSLFNLLLRLRRYRFTHAYNLVQRPAKLHVLRDALFFRNLVGIKNYIASKIHYPPPNNQNGILPLMSPKWRQLLELVDISINTTEFHLPLPEAAYVELNSIWPSHLDKNNKFVVLVPGSKMSAKCWPEARFTELGQLLLQYIPDLKIAIVGGAEDAALGERLCTILGNDNCFNFSGKLSVLGSAALLEHSTLFIGNDTGSMHLAAFVGVPCVAIFSSRDYPGRWAPFGNIHTILRQDLECSGCMLETCVDHNNACLVAISTECVFYAALAQLKRLNIMPQSFNI